MASAENPVLHKQAVGWKRTFQFITQDCDKVHVDPKARNPCPDAMWYKRNYNCCYI
jgi:hypothetical protein